MILVKTAKIGSQVKEFALSDSANVAEAKARFTESGESLTGLEARVDNQVVDDSYELEDGDIVSFVPAKGIKGGHIAR